MDIATNSPQSNFDGRFVVVSVESGSKRIELALSAYHALRLYSGLRLTIDEAMKAQEESSDNVIEFRRNQDAD